MLKVPVKVETECVAECFFQHVMPTVRPHWDRERIQFKEFNGGYSNRIVGISQTGDDTDIILFRMHLTSAQSLETLFDREMEIKVMELLHQAGLNPPVYCRFENAICYGFAQGRPVTQDDLDNRKVRRCIAVTMARYHSSIASTGLDCKSWVDKLSNWLPETVPKDDITAEMDRMGCTFDYLKDQFRKAKTLLDTFKSPKVLCHNDTHRANMIYDEKEGRVTFIDQEAVGLAHVSCEIGNFFRFFVGIFEGLDLSLYPKEDVQKDFIKLYLEEKSRVHNAVGQPAVSSEEVEALYTESRMGGVVQMLIEILVLFLIIHNLRSNGLSVDVKMYLGLVKLQHEYYKTRKDDVNILQ